MKMRKSDKWWKELWRRQEAAYDRFCELGPDASDDEIIEATAEYLITHGSPRRPHRLHLSILNMSEDRPVAYDWRHANVWGISTTDEDRARAWVRQCMRQGYGVAGSYTKNGLGGGMGSLEFIREQKAKYLP
jgi:hypothetical protein